MLSRKNYTQSGSHILEIALVIPVLFFIVLGAFDINTALQSYTALQEGVNKAIRCSYTTDGNCTKVNEGTRSSIYQVTKYDPTYIYIVREMDYAGEGWKTFLPSFHILPGAIVADKVSYSPNQYKQEGTVSYAVQTYSLPYVHQDTVANPGLNPEFSAGNGGDEYPSEAKIIASTANISKYKKDAEHNVIGETDSIIIHRKFNNPNGCFVAKNLDSPSNINKNFKANDVDFGKECDSEKARILIDVEGETLNVKGNADPDNKSNVVMSIDYDYGSTPYELKHLGGRQISSASSQGNFSVRGLILDPGTCELKPSPLDKNKLIKIDVLLYLT